VVVLDSSAILAFLWEEPGSDRVQEALAQGAVCPVANWSEVAAKVLARGGDWLAAEIALTGLGLTVVPVEVEDAVRAARLWLEHPALSLGDRLCLAVGLRMGATVVTADQAWRAVSDQVTLIRLGRTEASG